MPKTQTAKRDEAAESIGRAYQFISPVIPKRPHLLQELAQNRIDKKRKASTNNGLTPAMLETPPVTVEPIAQPAPVERPRTLEETLQAVIEPSIDDLAEVMKHPDLLPEVRVVLERVHGRLSSAKQGAPSLSHAKVKGGVVSSVEDVLSSLPKYTDEEVAEMRQLRAEVEAMVAEFVAVDESRESAIDKNNRKIELLKKYGLEKWGGAAYGDLAAGTAFVKQHYKRWLDAGVIFKDELRCMDSELVTRVRDEVYRGRVHDDPIPTIDKKTNRQAAGLLSTGYRQAVAVAVVSGRASQRDAKRFRQALREGEDR